PEPAGAGDGNFVGGQFALYRGLKRVVAQLGGTACGTAALGCVIGDHSLVAQPPSAVSSEITAGGGCATDTAGGGCATDTAGGGCATSHFLSSVYNCRPVDRMAGAACGCDSTALLK